MLDEKTVLNTHWKELAIKCREMPALKDYIFELAAKKREELALLPIIVTGSAGKTTTKELIGLVLEKWNRRSYVISPENQNTKLALATLILKMSSETELGVFEVGARHVNDLQISSGFLKPKIALLLNIGLAHVGEFGSLENLVNEKLSLLQNQGLELAIVNGDDERIIRAATKVATRFISFGQKDHNSIQLLSENESSLEFFVKAKVIRIPIVAEIPNYGINVAAVIALTEHLKIPLTFVQEALAEFQGVHRRFQKQIWQGVEVIDDSFNASPESMFQGLTKISKLASDKKLLLILGSMKELATFSVGEHRKLGQLIQKYFIKHIEEDRLKIILIGDEAREISYHLAENENISWFSRAIDSKDHVQSIKNEFDLIYLKGSKSTELSSILG